MGADGFCQSASLGITGVAAKAYRARAVEIALAGNQLDEQTIAGAVSHVCEGIDPNSDLHASGEYRCHLAQVHTRRAIQTALQRAK